MASVLVVRGDLTIWLPLRGDCIIIHAKAQVLLVQWQISSAVWGESNDRTLLLTRRERGGEDTLGYGRMQVQEGRHRDGSERWRHS